MDPVTAEITAEILGRELETLARDRVAPNVALACAIKRGGTWTSQTAGDVEMPFDLASLTKPMTAVAIAGTDLRRAALADVCSEHAGTASAHASLELLLSHRAGLFAHIPIFAPLVTGGTLDVTEALRVASSARRLDATGPYPAWSAVRSERTTKHRLPRTGK